MAGIHVGSRGPLRLQASMLAAYFGIERANAERWPTPDGVCVRTVTNAAEFTTGSYHFCKYCSLTELMEHAYMFIFIFMCGYVYIYM